MSVASSHRRGPVLAIITIVLLSLMVVAARCQSSGSCTANSQQIQNVDSLRALIRSEVQAEVDAEVERRLPAAVEAEVERRLRSTPALGLLYINRYTDDTIVLYNISGSTLRGFGARRAQFSLADPSISVSSNNILAYHPNFTDIHSSGLGALFVNLVVAFPCLDALQSYPPICKVFTFDDDGFRDGRAIIEAADTGNNLAVFNGTLKGVFGFGFTGCPQFTRECYPRFAEYIIACYLPRNICGHI